MILSVRAAAASAYPLPLILLERITFQKSQRRWEKQNEHSVVLPGLRLRNREAVRLPGIGKRFSL